MELPNYRMPGAKNVGHLLWDKAKDFLQRAFTVIFMATLAYEEIVEYAYIRDFVLSTSTYVTHLL